MRGINPVRQSAEKIIKSAKFVRLNRAAIKLIAEKWSKEKIIVPFWPRCFHFWSGNQRRLIDYLIILDGLNFCFWSKDEKWRINYKNKIYDGYFALSLSLKRFFERNKKKEILSVFAGISYARFKKIFNGKGNLLLMRKRWLIARRISRYFIKEYEGDSLKFIFSAGGSALKLAAKIASELFSFNDEYLYNGSKVYFWKRAQILVADIWGSLGGKGAGSFKDIDCLTAFADYKLPQILYHFGIMEFSPALSEKIKRREIILAGSTAEIEIRGAAVWAIELLTRYLNKYGKKIRPLEVDWILWNKSQNVSLSIPHHLTKTTFY